ncbi:MAG: lipoyl synthase [Candidatus Thermoplasmatota archaeon]|nr:lipoyl synthase [Candidatus Thermoplasmatota archaeon]
MTVRKLSMADTRPRLPEWFRTSLPTGELQRKFKETKETVTDNMLHTVCQEARCPNIHECWAAKDATFMVAGQECTRGCRFCAVGSIKTPPPLDENEPANLADAISTMGLNHAVITVVNRDDLPDSGASHYRKCLEAVRERTPEVTLELLCSDLAGDHQALHDLLNGLELEVFAHNVECVPRLDSKVRDHRATFEQSIGILKEAKRLRPEILTKSSIMVGLGETDDEITEALQLLKDAGVDLITIGQYLAPSPKHLAVDRFPEPERYDLWSKQIEDMGFLGWACGPLVRSSYKAGELLSKASARLRTEKE